MAEINITSTKLSEALQALVEPAFDAKALLLGAIALLNEAEAIPDPHGDVWAALRLIEEASGKMDKIYGDKEIALRNRIIELEEVAA